MEEMSTLNTERSEPIIVGCAYNKPRTLLKGIVSVCTLLFGWLVALSVQAQTQPTINLSLHTYSNTQSPAIGDVVTYSVVVTNAPGSATATGITVQDNLPAEGVAFVPGSASVVRGTATFTTTGSTTATVGTLSIPAIAPGDSAILVFKATVQARGVWFNIAEITAAGQTDTNSVPNNHSLTEDDYDAICFSVPILWYVGDQYTITVPSGYDQIVWYREVGGVSTAISSSAVSTSLAEVNSDFSLTIKSPGTYRFVTYRAGCPSTNCCDIIMQPGPYGSLGDFVFLDTNRNGAQDTGEPGIDKVKVYLYDSKGTTKLDSTVTAGGGKYLFDSLTDGSYTVRFIAPTNYQSTSANVAGVPDDLDSDAGTNGFTGVYTIDTSQPVSSTARNNTTVDAGYFPSTASLGDYVFVDLNKNGIQDPTDIPLAGVVVTLLDANNNPVASLTTTATGLYSFTGLTPGVPYSVSFVAPTGYMSTSALMGGDDTRDSDVDPVTGRTRSVTLAAGENNVTLDAGYCLPMAELGDYVFVDANKNGIQDAGDSPLAGVVVTLLDANNSPITSVTTTATGLYSFMDLMPGEPYSVSFATPTGYMSTSAQVGGDDTKDSDADPITGRTRSVTLASGENNVNLDAGYYIPTASLGNFVFVDANRNGIQDPSDSPLAGVVVTLLNANNSPITSVTTTTSGLYSFTGLTPGVPYSVSFAAPTGYVSTSALLGGDDTKDSDVDPVTGRTRSVTLANGENNLNLDAGFYLPTASLGDYVFSDNNTNGIQDTGDTPIAGVVVVLLDGTNSPIRSTTTNTGGLYSFTGLTPGIPYSVSFVATGRVGIPVGAGDDTKDSDADPVTGKTRSVTLAPGENNLNLDAGFAPLCPTNFSVVASSNQIICPGDVAVLTATASTTAAQIHWYSDPNGSPFATTSSGASLTVNPAITTVYYAEAFTANGCVSPRKPVSVSVTTVPTPIALGIVRNTCPARTVDLTQVQISNAATQYTYEWYNGQTRSVATRITNLTAVGAGTYYLFAKSGNCYSNPTVITVEIVDCNCQNPASVTAVAVASICSGDAIPLQATIGGSATAVTWSTSTGGSFSAINSLATSFTPSAADLAAGSVQITVTTNDPDGICPATAYTLLVKINKRPDAPVSLGSDDATVCQGNSTKLIGFVPNGQINWYDATGKLVGTTVSGNKLVIIPTKVGATIYYAEAVSLEGCISSTRSSLTVTVGACRADLAVVKQVVTPAPYSIGQKITYSIKVTNNGPITANDVQVRDVLPASLTYVSSTPTGQYNPATSLWAVGTLTANSDRTLLIETMVVGAGSVRNIAVVSSPDNDPLVAVNDTSVTTIQTGTCTVQPPALVCAITEICKGGTTILSAKGCDGGTVKWSDGKTGMTIFATPSMTTTYTASCVVSNCVSGSSEPIIVTVDDPKAPIITASADNVCPGASLTLTASGCVGGVIEWSDKAQMGPSIVVMPYSKTTYTAQCRMGSCLSVPAVKAINISSDIPAPTVVCSTSVVCPGETLTLTVENCVGTPVWNSTTATTGSIVVTPTLGSNSYYVYCKNGACISKSSPIYTINVVAPVIPTVTASADTICAGGSVTLTAADCNGTVVWNVEGKTGPSITVSPTANISYFAQCRYRTCLSAPSNTANIAVVTPTAPIVKVSKTMINSGDPVSLSATGCNGTVQWHSVDKVGASITIYPTQTAEYYATCKQGSCESDPSNKVRVTVNTSTVVPPVVVASTNAICSGGLVSLSATGCDGTVKWFDGQTGPVISVTATPANHEFYAICIPTSATTGSGKSNVISVSVTPTPMPSIERCLCSNDTICPGENVKLTVKNCQGIPHWSTGETKTSIIVSPTATTGYSVYCQDGACTSAATARYTITVIPVAEVTVTASATTIAPGGTVTLYATGCNGTVIWSANDINGNNKGASIVVRPEGTQTYYAQCKFRECLSDPSVTIVINPGDCSAKAGSLAAVNATVCGSTSTTVALAATLNGGLVQPNGYSVVYVLTKGATKVVQQTSTTPQFSVSAGAGQYTIHTLVYNANSSDKDYLNLSLVQPGVTTAADVLALIGAKCAALDVTGANVTVTAIEPPVLSAALLTVCSSGPVSLSATGCVGGTITWSDGTVGNVYTKAISSNKTLTAICTLNGCTSQPSTGVQVTLGTPAVPIIVSNSPAVCLGEVVSLTATGCEGGNYIWSDGKTVGSTLTIMPNADVSYRVKCKVGDCEGDWSAYTTIKVGAPSAPTISIAGTNNTTVCFGAPITLTAQGCGPNSYVTWSNNQVGNSITISPAASTTFTARCCTSNQCKSVPSNAIAVTVLSKVPQPGVRDITNTCPAQTAELAKGITSSPATTGGVFEYYSDAALTAKVADPAHVVGGTYYVIERTVNGCVSLPVLVHVQITTCTDPTPCDPTNLATANAGADASVCASKSYQLLGLMGGGGKTAHWSTSGSGNFDNPYSLNAVYTASAEDIISGKVTLTLSVSTNNAACSVATDAMLLSIDGIKTIPTITAVGGLSLCYGDSIILKAPVGAVGYQWNNGLTTQTIVVKASGAYSVQLLDSKGCSSIKSENMVINVAEPVLPPLVHDLRNTCPAKIVDLTKALSMTTIGTSYTYRICECNTSNIVMRPDSVCEGTYWVVAKNANGCVSTPAKVMVHIVNCAVDTLNADVSITKLASTALVQNGAPVTYTLTVSNAGPHTAKNIEVRDVLPNGLELVATTAPSYSVSYGILTQRIDSLKVGQSTQIVYAAHITTKGQTIVNTAEIVYLDNKDSNIANNVSSVSVTDNTTRRASQIGIAKAVLGQPTSTGDSLIQVSYRFVVTNFGDDTLRKVQIADDLAYSFSPNKVTETKVTVSNPSSTLHTRADFAGSGSHLMMIDSTSYLAPGHSETFELAVTVKRAAGDTTHSFKNYAVAAAVNSLTTVSDISTDGGDADPDGDGNPTNNTSAASFTLGVSQAQGPSIGLALAVVKMEPQLDSTYLVTYKATIKNYGNVALQGITLIDSLQNAFVAPTSYTIVGTPMINASSTLVANTSFNGSTQPNLLLGSSTLGAGVQDTVLITVKVKPNGNNGPFYSSVTVAGHTPDLSQTVMDISNNGLDPAPAGSTSTTVRFDLPKGLLGVAKSVGKPVMVSEGVYDIPYTIGLCNMGTVELKNVQVEDKLSETFGHGALIVSNQIAVTATGTSNVKVNPAYTGQGMITKMLIDSVSTLPVGGKAYLNFTVRVDVRNADSLVFYNTAVATAMTPDSQKVEDASTAGTNDDPDNDLDPRNNNQPTPIALNGSATTSFLGLAMSVRDTTRQADGSYHVTYQIVAKAYGPDPLKHVTITDSLAQVFNTQTGATYSVVGSPLITSSGSALKLNPAFNGGSDPVLVVGDSTSQLAAGHADTLLVVLSVSANGSTTTFLNSAYGQAVAKSGLVSEVSTSGLEPDPNGNGNPTDSNEREATALTLPASYLSVFIPEGFSPNGDGINDEFVFRGVSGLTVSLEVYNRWGHLVYQNADYRNDWDGKPNTGTVVGSDSNGVPDGTYYYVINLSDGRKFVRYMTINR